MEYTHPVKRTALVVFLCGLVLCSTGGAHASGRTSLASQLDALVATGSPGAILFVRQGDHVSTLTSGLAARPTVMMTPGATFRIGSLTKTQVATVVLQLAGEGKLSLGDHVDRYFPGLIREGATITIRELLDHTSGIPDFDSDPRVLAPYLGGNLGYVWTPRKLIAVAESHRRAFAPGARYSYSNTNYLVLGLIVEKLTGRPLDTVLADRIYKPLGLKSTHLQTAPSDPSSVHGYYVLGKPPAADLTGLSPYPWAAGAVVSSAQDVAAFYRGLLTGRLLPPTLLREMETTVPEPGKTDFPRQQYGLGLERFGTPCGVAWGHAGNFPGYIVYAFTSADGSRQAVLMLNEDPASLPKTTGPLFERLLVSAYCSRLAG